MTTPGPDPRIDTDIGPYRIEAVIGRGGMVSLPRGTGPPGPQVALKIVSPEFSDDPRPPPGSCANRRWRPPSTIPTSCPSTRPTRPTACSSSPCAWSRAPTSRRAWPPDRWIPRAAAAILAQVAGALDAAHARGLVHRDVKPANILLSLGASADQGDHAYLTDFGLTKRGGSDTSLTAAGGFAGTLAYIAPEQVDGREIDGRADQYSLACMAFECLTAPVPFVRETDIATAMAHIKDPPPSALALQPTLPAAVDAVLARGMAKAPDDRYPTCGAFMADLRARSD